MPFESQLRVWAKRIRMQSISKHPLCVQCLCDIFSTHHIQCRPCTLAKCVAE